jgi:hypothetical protein
MRAAEARARADEMKEAQPKAIMLRIAADFEELLSSGPRKTQYLGGTKNQAKASRRGGIAANGRQSCWSYCDDNRVGEPH